MEYLLIGIIIIGIICIQDVYFYSISKFPERKKYRWLPFIGGLYCLKKFGRDL
jgi:hypothetical protein